jgi:hypothetical protein
MYEYQPQEVSTLNLVFVFAYRWRERMRPKIVLARCIDNPDPTILLPHCFTFIDCLIPELYC